MKKAGAGGQLEKLLEATSLRNLSRLGFYLATKALEDAGFKGVEEIEGRHNSYGSLLALKGGCRYLIELKTRHKYKRNRKLNKRYKLAELRWTGSLYANAADAERRFSAKAHWVAVRIDKTIYSVYLGSLEQLRPKSGIPMAEANVRRYKCLAKNKSIARTVAAAFSKVRERRKEEWDVFICHASEDKRWIARPLAKALRAKRLRVWYDEFALKVGNSLRESIDYGLAHSEFGVVILSKHFFEKHWPQEELNGLATRKVRGKKVILPVWHGIGFKDVRRHSPILADILAVSTDKGVATVVMHLLRAMK